MNNLRQQSQILCEQEDLQEKQKLDVEQSVGDVEGQWGAVLQAAEDALTAAEAQILLDKDVDAFQSQINNVQAWIQEQDENLQSLVGQMDVAEKLQLAKVSCRMLGNGLFKEIHDKKPHAFVVFRQFYAPGLMGSQNSKT